MFERSLLLFDRIIADVKRCVTTRTTNSRSQLAAQLENRIMMSASPVPDAGVVTQPAVASTADQAVTEVVFVAADVEDRETLLADLRANDQPGSRLIVEMDAHRDGIEQITETLSTLNDVQSIHILAHGDEGELQLGNAVLNADNLSAYAGELTSWQDALSADADLLIYGCNLAGTADGQLLVEAVSELCNCDVAASEDLTGHRRLGGDWELEYQTGIVESQVIVGAEAIDAWTHALVTTQTISFQNDVNGYAGTVDTFLEEDKPDDDNSTKNDIKSHSDPGKANQALIRFEDIFGYAAGQIPYGSEINSVELVFNNVRGDDADPISLHTMLTNWHFPDTWNTLTDGVQLDDVEASSVALDTQTLSGTDVMTFSGESLRQLVQSWSDGATNYGFIVANPSTTEWKAKTSDTGSVADHPILTIDYTTPDSFANETVATAVNQYAAGNQTTVAGTRGATKAVATDPTGRHVVVWTSDSQDPDGSAGIYGQMFDRNGDDIGTEFRVNVSTSLAQSGASVDMDDQGNFVVTWTSAGQDGDGNGVFMRRFGPDGTPIDVADIQVNVNALGDQEDAEVAVTQDGIVTVVWTDVGNGIRARQFDVTSPSTDFVLGRRESRDHRDQLGVCRQCGCGHECVGARGGVVA